MLPSSARVIGIKLPVVSKGDHIRHVWQKWQFWAIVTSETNLYGGGCAESMFERHSTQQARQAQTQENSPQIIRFDF
jgi:hypothetical protein